MEHWSLLGHEQDLVPFSLSSSDATHFRPWILSVLSTSCVHALVRSSEGVGQRILRPENTQ